MTREIFDFVKIFFRFIENKEKPSPWEGLEQLCSPEYLANFRQSLKQQEKLETKIAKLQKLLKEGHTRYSDKELK